MGKRSDVHRSSILGNLFISLVVALGFWIIGLIKFHGVIPIVDERNKTQAQTQAIVVLTGGSGRLDEGLSLLVKHPKAVLFVSGVYEGNEVRHLLKLSKQQPSALGARIAIGNAINTHENALETAAWVFRNKIQTLRLVTAAYHMPRSLLEFKNVLPNTLIIAHPVFPKHVMQARWWVYPGTATIVIGEYNKLLLVWVRQKIEFVIKKSSVLGWLYNSSMGKS
jgi:uncharacterized SAM-binding protein YcdF (DUF218 family)